MIEIGDSCAKSIDRFGLDGWSVRTTVTEADNSHTVDMLGERPASMGFYEKLHDNRRIMAIRLKRDDIDTIVAVFVVPDIITPASNPLDTLRSVCDRYGIPIRVGDIKDKFILQTEVPAKKAVPQFDIPEGHEGLLQWGAIGTGRGTTYIALAFSLDMTEMLKDIG